MAINTGGGSNRGGTAADNEIKYVYRTITVNQIEQKAGGKQGKYWKAEDEKGRWYWVWSNTVVEALDTANDSGESIFVRIEVKPGKDPKRPFWTIVATGDEAKFEQSSENLGASGNGGGTFKEGGAAASGSQVSMGSVSLVDREVEILKAAVSLAVAEAEVAKPKEAQAFLEAQVVAYRAFLEGLLGHKAASAPAPEESADDDDDPDDDIPF